ncbi:hypothetical protein [Streptomyces chartreusis]|uniref:hypothetical protein n=1 Tax=Streptomyces chartreusis TaxID=1969 RepID=UPI0033F8319C
MSDETLLTACQEQPRKGSSEGADAVGAFTNLTQHCRYGGPGAHHAGGLAHWHCGNRTYPQQGHEIAPTPAPDPHGLDTAGVGAIPLLRVA